MTAMTFTGSTTTVNADADTWGEKNNNDKDAIAVDLQTLNTAQANTIKGNNTGSEADVMDLTATQVTAMLNPVVGATSGGAGTKGLVPQPTAGQNTRVLNGAGQWEARPRVLAWGVYDSSGLIAGFNVSSVTIGLGLATVNFTTALPTADYCVSLSYQHSTPSTPPYISSSPAPTTTALRINGLPTRVHVTVTAA